MTSSPKRRHAAGLMVFARSTGRLLFAQRSALVHQPHTWAFFGGHVEPGEQPHEAAFREFREETGFAGRFLQNVNDAKGQKAFLPHKITRTADEQVTYHTYLAFVSRQFEPKLNWETSHALWAPPESPPTPLHPGVERTLKQFCRVYRR